MANSSGESKTVITINLIVSMALKVRPGNQKFLHELRHLVMIEGEDSLEEIMHQGNTVPSSDQVSKVRDNI